jgi:hypothetical protein
MDPHAERQDAENPKVFRNNSDNNIVAEKIMV